MFHGRIAQMAILHCVSKNYTDVTHYSLNAHQPILVIFGSDVAEREYAIEWWSVIPPLLTNVSALPGETWTQEIISSHAGYSPRPSASSSRNQILYSGWSSGHRSEVQISSKSVKRFRMCVWGGWKFAIQNWFGRFPIDLAKSVRKGKFDRHSSEIA